MFGEALALANHRPELAHVRAFCLGYMAFAAAEIDDPRNSTRWAVEALQLVEEAHLNEIAQSAIAYAAGALTRQQRGDHTGAARHLDNARRLSPLLHGVPWLKADVALRCAGISLSLGDLAGAVAFKHVAGDTLQGYPDAGTLPARLQRLEERIRRGEDYELTPAELRLIHFLPTHLSLQEIADRLYLSRATVKTHVASIYTKLGVPSRSEAVEIIDQSGLGSTGDRIATPIRIATEARRSEPFGRCRTGVGTSVIPRFGKSMRRAEGSPPPGAPGSRSPRAVAAAQARAGSRATGPAVANARLSGVEAPASTVRCRDVVECLVGRSPASSRRSRTAVLAAVIRRRSIATAPCRRPTGTWCSARRCQAAACWSMRPSTRDCPGAPGSSRKAQYRAGWFTLFGGCPPVVAGCRLLGVAARAGRSHQLRWSCLGAASVGRCRGRAYAQRTAPAL